MHKNLTIKKGHKDRSEGGLLSALKVSRELFLFLVDILFEMWVLGKEFIIAVIVEAHWVQEVGSDERNNHKVSNSWGHSASEVGHNVRGKLAFKHLEEESNFIWDPFIL